ARCTHRSGRRPESRLPRQALDPAAQTLRRCRTQSTQPGGVTDSIAPCETPWPAVWRSGEGVSQSAIACAHGPRTSPISSRGMVRLVGVAVVLLVLVSAIGSPG